MKKLLQINTVVNSGSTGRIAEELGKIAIEKGWKSYIAYGRNKRPSQSKIIRVGNTFTIALHVFVTRIFDRHGLASYWSTKSLIKKIKYIKPSIIHLSNLHGYYINIDQLFNYLSKTDIPIVWTLYDCWALTGHCSYFDYANCDKWKTQCFNCPQKNNYPRSYVIDRSKKNYLLKKELFNKVKNLTILTNSNWLANIVKQSFLNKYPINVINSGIDLRVFNPKAITAPKFKSLLKDKFKILGVANKWEPRKGLPDFISLSKIIDKDTIIILVGISGNQIKNLTNNIITIPKTENTDELAQLYTLADVFLNPTWEDNFPTTNLEALACGTPVITFNTGGSPEALDEKTGIVVEKGDIVELNNAVKEIQSRGKDFYSETCIARAKKYYDKNDRYPDYIQLYNSLLD